MLQKKSPTTPDIPSHHEYFAKRGISTKQYRFTPYSTDTPILPILPKSKTSLYVCYILQIFCKSCLCKKILLYFLLGAINRIKNTNSTLQFIHILLTSFKKGQFYELRISADIRFYCQKRQLTVQPFCCGFRTNLITDTQRKPDTHIRKIKNK